VGLAQQTGIGGRVTDPTKAVVETVIVTATGDDGTKVKTVTNEQGIYQFPTLRAEKYVLRFEAPGFAPAERTVALLVGQSATVDILLQLATASASIAVESTAAAVDTTSSTLAGDVSPTEVSKVPLNGRNYLQLAMMVPGITSNDVTNSPLGTTDSGKLQINLRPAVRRDIRWSDSARQTVFLLCLRGRAPAEYYFRYADRLWWSHLHLQQPTTHQQLPAAFGLHFKWHESYLGPRVRLHLERPIQ
jgi:hypothetical protein